jgi:hypothetical protein
MGTPRSPIMQDLLELNRDQRDKWTLGGLLFSRKALSHRISTRDFSSIRSLKEVFPSLVSPTPPRRGLACPRFFNDLPPLYNPHRDWYAGLRSGSVQSRFRGIYP